MDGPEYCRSPHAVSLCKKVKLAMLKAQGSHACQEPVCIHMMVLQDFRDTAQGGQATGFPVVPGPKKQVEEEPGEEELANQHQLCAEAEGCSLCTMWLL